MVWIYVAQYIGYILVIFHSLKVVDHCGKKQMRQVIHSNICNMFIFSVMLILFIITGQQSHIKSVFVG